MCLYGKGVGQTVDEILSYLPPTTRAERIHYWFDEDVGTLSELSQMEGAQAIDVSGLIDGMHTLHCQIEDNLGAVASPQSIVFLKFTKESMVGGVGQLQYWFDDNQIPTSVSSTSGIQLLDVSSLLDGLHTVHYQVVDENGKVTPPYSQVFMKIAQYSGELSLKTLLYWYDDETEVQTLPITSGVQVLDASALLEGLHTLHYQVVCNDGSLAPAYSSIFLRMNKDQNSTAVKELRYWFDEETQANVVEAVSGVQVLDASALLEGLHTLHYQVVDETGNAGSPCSSVFLKMDTEQSVAQRQRYWFDDDPTTLHEAPVTSGVQLLDVDGLLTGLHTLHYQLVDEQGRLSSPHSSVFIKLAEHVLPSGENAITDYMYWMNDYSQDNVKVTLPQPASPYHLQALLPTIKAPIRSSMFHFEVTNGQPTVYAKNDIHVRFYDAAGYWADDARSFIDYAVSETLDDITELQTSQTFNRPAQNDIKWFSLQAEKGDTIAFRSSQATSLQVFSPTGQEVYAASADKSVKFGGCHTWEDGTYYVAVHDVTGTRQNVTLDYIHMDRYDVVAQDVYTVGNGGASTITYQGNGFNDLYAVDFVNSQNDTIKCKYIEYIDNASASIIADFNDVTLGTYDAIFYFAEGKKVLEHAVNVENASDIRLSTSVSYNTTFLRSAGKTSYAVKIKNMGNMTSYRTPVYIYISSKSQDGIGKIKINGLGLPNLYEGLEKDSIPLSEKEQVKNLCDKIGDTHYFINAKTVNSNSQDSIYARSAYFFIDVAPTSVYEFSIDVYANETVEAYVTVPSINMPCTTGPLSPITTKSLVQRASVRENYCCIRNKVECVATIVADVAGLTNTIMSLTGSPHAAAAGVADCVASSISQIVSATGIVMCDDNNVEKNFWDKVHDVLNGISVTGTLSSCASKVLPWKQAKALLDKVGDVAGNTSMVFGIGVDIVDCVSAFVSKVPNCPPNSGGGGGSSTPVNSYDPNDIYGYTAESGSRFMSDKVQQVNYRIEFENDTTFATASAHVVEIKDTLNEKLFDLNSYAPTGIKIGDRTEMLDGKPQFVRTIDMRPQINALAQVEGFYDKLKGIITYRFTSVDPMTMEPTDDVMQGFLPVNVDGTSGIGEVSYNVNLLKAFDDGTQISNRASIVFDTNEAILTPVWTNTIDAVCPEGRVKEAVLRNDTTATIHCVGSDERSGVWKYEVYVQYGSGELWEKVGECPADSAEVSFRVYDGMDYGFCALAVDSAGNVEVKEMAREASLGTYLQGDANADGIVDIEDVVNATRYFLGETEVIYFKAADVTADNQIDIEDVVGIRRIFLTQPTTLLKAPVKRQRLRELLQP